MHAQDLHLETSGSDVYGLWRVVAIAGVEIKLRWLPAGVFNMGSTELEVGRTSDEGPQHEVHIGKGMWLFETPVTQAMWMAVTGRNPSHFRSPSRPVEGVSFHDVQWFIALVSEQQPAFQLSLPSEAQWEYACRAGTDTATWCGDLELCGLNNAPVLNDIAWYAGNASFAFREAHGVDSSSWLQCEYKGARAGTHPVGFKQPNPWGLYDMLGNVWEWCSDSMRDYSLSETPLLDPVGGTEDAVRCARGGSWRDGPQKLRAAYRDQIELPYHNDFVGFRCVLEFDE